MMLGLVLLLWLLGSLSLGLCLAMWGISTERRLAVVLAYAVTSGHCAQSVLLIILWGAFPLGDALYAVLALSLVTGATALWRTAARGTSANTWGMPPADTALVAALIAVFAFLGYRVFTAAYTSWDAEAIYWHSALAGWLQQGTYPPTSPLEPEDVLRYRFGLHTLAAAISANAGASPPQALAATTGLMLAMTVPALVGASIQLFGGSRPGIVAAILALLGGSLMPWYRLGLGLTRDSWRLDATLLDALSNHWRQGFLWGGNTLDMLTLNVSISSGFVAFVMALWLAWGMLAQDRPTLRGGAAALGGLAYLGFTNEVYFASLLAGLAAATAFCAVRAHLMAQGTWWRPTVLLLAIAAAAFFVVSLRGGMLGGIALANKTPGSLQLVLNTEHLGWVVTAPHGGQWEWVPLISPNSLVDSDLWIVAVPFLLLVAWRTQNLFASIGLLASTAAFAAWTLIYPKAWPADAFRFAQVAFATSLTLAPFALASMWRGIPPIRSRLRYWAEGLLLAALIAPHLLVAISAAVHLPLPTQVVPNSPDVAASLYLGSSKSTHRVLIPLPPGTVSGWEFLYSGTKVASAMRVVLGLSGHSIPMGHQAGFFNPDAYLPTYKQASASFDAQSLAAMKIDWVYTLPAYLDDEQRLNLRTAVERGELQLERTFGDPGTSEERALMRVKRPGS